MATIKVDLDRTTGEIDRRVFGNFIEHLGRCIYGGVYDEASSQSDERGFRRDVLAAARGLGVTVLRWPGGNFVSGYHWTDGIGPRESRPTRNNLAWNAVETNRFGTDEFIAYCGALGAEPYICLNMGSGTMDEACAWLEYCNGAGDTYWAEQRRRNGHDEPYGVRYWGLGNEMYGHWQIGALSAEDYVRKAREWAKVLRWTDPDIELVSCGETGLTDWDRVVVEGLAAHVDHHSLHLYTGAEDYWRNVLSPLQAERGVLSCEALIERVRYDQQIARPVGIAFDEWNVWFRESAGDGAVLEERYRLADALAVATYLNVFVRNSRIVKMANLAQMVNVIAPIMTRGDEVLLQAIYHPLQLVTRHTERVTLDPLVICDEIEYEDPDPIGRWPHRLGDLSPFPVLDVAATRAPDESRAVLSVVNRDPDRSVATRVVVEGCEPAGAVRVYEVGGPGPDALCTFEEPDAVAVAERRAVFENGAVAHDFAPHSASVMILPLTPRRGTG